MNNFSGTRGRILSRSQVSVSESPVALGEKQKCVQRKAAVSLKTDPSTGDLLEIRVECSCGEVTILECHYDGEIAVR